MKKGKQEKKVEVKNFTQPKDIVPDKLVPTLKVREPKPPKPVEPGQADPDLANRYVQDPLFEEWPADDVIAAYDFGLTTDKPFNDTAKIPMPPSFKETSSVVVSFKRYKDYLASVVEKNELAVSKRSLVKQNTLVGTDDLGSPSKRAGSPLIRLRAGTVDFDSERIDIGDFQRRLELNTGTPEDKVDVKVCEYFERPETPEEAEERKKREEANAKGKKKPAATDKKKGQQDEVIVADPRNKFTWSKSLPWVLSRWWVKSLPFRSGSALYYRPSKTETSRIAM